MRKGEVLYTGYLQKTNLLRKGVNISTLSTPTK
jgi:hypothetical protein